MNWILSILLGLSAALIDTLPMFMKRLDKSFILSAFCFWLIAGILVPRIHLTSWNWLNGLLCCLMLLIPLLPLIFRQDKPAIPQIIASTLLLGALLGFLSGKWLTL